MLPARFSGSLLFVYLGISLAIGWSFLAWHLHADRERSLQSMRNQLTVIATSIAYNFTAMAHDGVGAARAAANEIAARQRAGVLTPESAADILKRMLTGGDYVRALFVISGGEFYSAVRPDETSLAEISRPHWAEDLLNSKFEGSVWIGPPIVRDVDSRVVIQIAEKVVIGDESLWAGAILSGETFQSIAKTLVPEQGGVALTTYDGTVVMRAPVDRGHYVGLNIANSDAFRRAAAVSSDTIFLDSVHPVTLQPRIIVARRVKDLPLFASAGRDKDVVLARWRQRTTVSLQIASAASIALTFLTYCLFVLMRRRHEALRESEERFHLAVSGTSDGIWDWNILTDETYYSPRFKKLLEGNESVEFPAVAESFWKRVHPEDLSRVRKSLEDHFETGTLHDTEARLMCAEGFRWFRLRGAAVRGPDGRPVRMAGSISDVHQRHEAEDSLRQAQEREIRSQQWFSEQLLTAQEGERTRVANELHDSIGQSLSIVKNRAVLALQQPGIPDAARDHIKHLSDVTTTAIAELRAVTHNLLPVQVEQWGLTEALRLLTEQFEKSYAVKVHCRIEQVDDVLRGVEAMHVFRMVQEMLSNVAKHARASSTRVRVERDVHCVRVEVCDDGVGLPESPNTLGRGLGLASIQHRARALTATLRVDSSPNRGVHWRMEVPIPDLSSGAFQNIRGESVERAP
jgi:signal transduction histidine kinase